MGAFDGGTIFEVSEDVVARKNNQDVVILMKMDDSSSFFKIDGVAARVWELLSEKMDYATIIQNITDEYDTEKSQVESDVDGLINKLKEIDAIR